MLEMTKKKEEEKLVEEAVILLKKERIFKAIKNYGSQHKQDMIVIDKRQQEEEPIEVMAPSTISQQPTVSLPKQSEAYSKTISLS